MDWTFEIYFLLFSGFQLVMSFNIESIPWKQFTRKQDTAFGYRVIQNDHSSLIVSDPLLQSLDKRGKVYRCTVNSPENCLPIQMNEPGEAVNMSLGLSLKMSKDQKILACGPTIPKDCKVTTTYNGMCFRVDNGNVNRIPSRLRDCPPPPQTDIAFLLDGSGSVSYWDFSKMKTFVIKLVQGLITRDVQFAVAQYSHSCRIHIDFTTTLNQWQIDQIMGIQQMRGGTLTASAINTLVNDLFAQKARANANRVLVVITDGESMEGADALRNAVKRAEQNNIIRYAIGVGNAFNKQSAENELNIIASDPVADYKFKVDNFDVLEQIRKKLEANIIAIEGTQKTGDSSRMEFAQEGFNAAFFSNGNIILSAVGAYQWKGGYQEYVVTGRENSQFQMGSQHDSYLGYSMTVATTLTDTYVVMGAPRYDHKGRVLLSGRRTELELDSPEPQIGAYYGAEICVVDLNSDSNADLLLVAAPFLTHDSQEGKIFVYSFPFNVFRSPVLVITLKGMAGQRGRFGSSLASPGDLNGDKFADIVVGSPQEDNGQGSIYIFNGRTENIESIYSQRISGSSVRSGLRFFGVSLSEAAVDHNGDTLPDIAVGSKGTVVLLRSRPIVSLMTRVTYNPSKISTRYTDCNNPLENTLHLCFTLRGNNIRRGWEAVVNYTLKLDAKRQNFRAYFSLKKRIQEGNVTVSLQEKCFDHKFLIEACTEDALNPVSNELTFTFEGRPIPGMENLKPILLPSIRNTSDHNLDFEINCGNDNICIDNLKMDFNFSGHSDIKVGIMQDMDVTVSVENRGENSYNSHVLLTYPFGLSFRRFTSKLGRVECVSVDSDQKVALGETTCYISKPIFRENSLAVFEITYSISKESNFDRRVTFNANAASGNDKHSEESELSKNRTIDVKYAIYVALIRHESSSIHINFTAGKNNLQKSINQIFKVENELRDVNLTIVIRVPVKLGDKDIWYNNNLKIENCTEDGLDPPKISDFKAALKKHHELNCSVATCKVFKCNANLMRREVLFYNISGSVSSGWIQQTELRSAVFDLISTATLEYDQNKYVYFSSDSLHTAPIGKITTQVEVYEEKNLLKEIIGGAVGGLLLLALITAGLYKAGFFKSQYKQMLKDAGADGAGEGAQASGGDSAPVQ